MGLVILDLLGHELFSQAGSAIYQQISPRIQAASLAAQEQDAWLQRGALRLARHGFRVHLIDGCRVLRGSLLVPAGFHRP
jgi:hypothetical protein